MPSKSSSPKNKKRPALTKSEHEFMAGKCPNEYSDCSPMAKGNGKKSSCHDEKSEKESEINDTD